MSNKPRGLYFLKSEHKGEVCLLIDIQGGGPGKFLAKKLTNHEKEPIDINVNSEDINIPSLYFFSEFAGLKKATLFLLCNIIYTTRLNGGAYRLNTGFTVVNGEISALSNSPENYGEAGNKALSEILYNKVGAREADWSILYYFTKKNNEPGVNLKLFSPDKCLVFFMPIISYRMDNGDIYFNLDTTKTELVEQSDGVAFTENSQNKIKDTPSLAKENPPPSSDSNYAGTITLLIIISLLIIAIYFSQ